MDLMNLAPKGDTFTVELRHPITDEVIKKDSGEPMTITVYSPFSDKYRQVQFEQQNDRIKRAQKKGKTSFTAEDISDLTLDLLAKTTADWSVQLDGKTPKFSEKAVREVYEKLPYIKLQVLEAQEDLSNFLNS